MRTTITGFLLAFISLLASPLAALGCGGVYVVQRGDSLSQIADALYKNAEMWTAIHSNNLALVGENPDLIDIGMHLRLRCIDGRPLGLSGGEEDVDMVARAALSDPLALSELAAIPGRRVNLLTGSGFAPFTDSSLPGGGMLTDVVRAAMEAAHPDQGFAIHWVDDWTSHQDPLLANALLDIGFPWEKPDCGSDPGSNRCAGLKFSAPMFEVLILLFVDRARPFRFDSDADLQGRTLCRPAGLSTHIFDQNGRHWLASGHIRLETPASAADCFRLLTEGRVDAVVLNEFTGRKLVRDLGLHDRVRVAESRPVAIGAHHVVVHENHPDGDAILALFEAGLNRIRADGTYERIIDAHLTRIWAEF